VRSDLIFVDEGAINARDLKLWLEREAKKTKQPSLLVLVGAGVPTTDFTDIASAAHAAGFVHVQMGAQEPTTPTGGGR
jgi:biopolymer transport protein ExbD